ncbi:MAG: hypothetical protein JWM86_1399, partial [Thermoleophilia bacterium]|nr:hypothetical protein [Thermoleophilia bacterium]
QMLVADAARLREVGSSPAIDAELELTGHVSELDIVPGHGNRAA